MENKKFITTTSAETAEKLKTMGFQLIQQSNNSWTFLNNVKSTFEKSKDVAYTNLLFV